MRFEIEIAQGGFYVRKYRGDVCTAKLVFCDRDSLFEYLQEVVKYAPIRKAAKNSGT